MISVAVTPLVAWVDEEDGPWRFRTGEFRATAGNRSTRGCMRRLGFPVNGQTIRLTRCQSPGHKDGKGTLVLNTLNIAEHLGADPAADRILENILTNLAGGPSNAAPK